MDSVEKNKSRNPKDIASTNKLPLTILPPVPLAYTAKVLWVGSEEYGVANWRSEPIKRSVYDNAIARHFAKYLAGEHQDEKSGMPHLAHIAANCLILMDAAHVGALTEDSYYGRKSTDQYPRVTDLIEHLTKGDI